MALTHLLYVSEAIGPMSTEDLETIHSVSSYNNRKALITGVLFYSAGQFVQLLEGDEADVHRLFETISADPRHRDVRVLLDEPIDRRLFGDWDMGLLDLTRHGSADRAKLDELVRLAGRGLCMDDGTPLEMEILSRFCMLLPAG
ncbi:MAG: BLUF domain-containing protein [Planctomycetota bacterium]